MKPRNATSPSPFFLNWKHLRSAEIWEFVQARLTPEQLKDPVIRNLRGRLTAREGAAVHCALHIAEWAGTDMASPPSRRDATEEEKAYAKRKADAWEFARKVRP